MSVPPNMMAREVDSAELNAAINDELGEGYAEGREVQTKAYEKLEKWYESDNLVPELEESEVAEIRTQIDGQYTSDYSSMDDWRIKYDRALELARMETKAGERMRPFKGAAKVMMPFLMEGATAWNARIVMDILASGEVVQPRVYGEDHQKAKAEKSDRQSTYLNYELTENMDWKRQTDKQLMAHPIVGTTYKKTYFDQLSNKYRSDFVLADEIVFSQAVSSIDDAPQITHKYQVNRNTVISNVNRGLWEYDIDKLDDDQVEFEILECHFWYDLDGDDYAEPWIAYIFKETEEIVRIVAGYEMEGIYEHEGKIYNIDREEFITQFQFLPDPKGGPMGEGWGILLGDIMTTINTNTRQLVDAGTIQNSSQNTGLIASTLSPKLNQGGRTQEGFVAMELGTYQTVQTASGASLRDSIFQMPSAGPSQTLFNLLQYLEEKSRKMMSSVWSMEVSSGEAASLYLARMKEAMKVPNSQVWRFYEGMRFEIKILYRMIEKHGDNDYYNKILDLEAPEDIRRDFSLDDCDVVPNCDPSLGSDVERMAKADFVTQLANNPISQGLMNAHEVLALNLKAADIGNAESILPPPEKGPSEQQKKEAAYQQMEAEFRMEEINVKKGELKARNDELLIKQEKLKIEAIGLMKDIEETDSKISLNNASAIEKLAGIESSQIADKTKLLEEANRYFAEDINGTNPQGGTS